MMGMIVQRKRKVRLAAETAGEVGRGGFRSAGWDPRSHKAEWELDPVLLFVSRRLREDSFY